MDKTCDRQLHDDIDMGNNKKKGRVNRNWRDFPQKLSPDAVELWVGDIPKAYANQKRLAGILINRTPKAVHPPVIRRIVLRAYKRSSGLKRRCLGDGDRRVMSDERTSSVMVQGGKQLCSQQSTGGANGEFHVGVGKDVGKGTEQPRFTPADATPQSAPADANPPITPADANPPITPADDNNKPPRSTRGAPQASSQDAANWFAYAIVVFRNQQEADAAREAWNGQELEDGFIAKVNPSQAVNKELNKELNDAARQREPTTFEIVNQIPKSDLELRCRKHNLVPAKHVSDNLTRKQLTEWLSKHYKALIAESGAPASRDEAGGVQGETNTPQDQATGDEQDQATGNDRDQATGNEQDQATTNEQDQATTNEQDQATTNEQDQDHTTAMTPRTRSPRQYAAVIQRHQGASLPTELVNKALDCLGTLLWPPASQRPGLRAPHYLVLNDKNNHLFPQLTAVCNAIMGWVDGEFEYTAVAVTKNLTGSPHVDYHDTSHQYAIGLGDYAGGELCVEHEPAQGARTIHVVTTRNRVACVDGRFVHWVRPFQGGDRYSLIFYTTNKKHWRDRTEPLFARS